MVGTFDCKIYKTHEEALSFEGSNFRGILIAALDITIQNRRCFAKYH